MGALASHLSVPQYQAVTRPRVVFVAALFLQILLAVKLGWLPLFGMVDTATHDSLSAT